VDTSDEVDTMRVMDEEPKRKRRTKRSFTPEFKAGAVRLVLDEGKTAAEVSRDLGLTSSSIRTWVNQARVDRAQGETGPLTTEERQELWKLRKQVRQLEMEREILKKAAAFFAKENT
jgi:transposase